MIVREFCFSTPRIIMQKCAASTITPTSLGARASTNASAIWSVSRSWTCSRRANTSTTLATFERPTTLPSGTWATCAVPKQGSMWCSHIE